MSETSREAVTARLRDLTPSATITAAFAALVVFEGLLVVAYLSARSVEVTNPLVFVYPFVWIDVSLLAILGTSPPTGTRRQHVVAALVAVGYFLVLGYFGGLYGIGHEMLHFNVEWGLPPGYSPAILYDGAPLRLVLEPYKVIGYLTLAYLVYTTVLDAAGAATSGVVGLFSCVSCSWPIIGTITTSLFGSGSAVAAFVLERSYGLGTLVFLSAVALLYYRPLVGE